MGEGLESPWTPWARPGPPSLATRGQGTAFSQGLTSLRRSMSLR